MPFQLSGLVRLVDLGYNPAEGMSKDNPGGGVSVKIRQVQRAVPSIKFVTEVDMLGNVAIAESLWFSAGDDMAERIDDWARYDGLKVLWTSDFEFTRWTGASREAIFDATDVVAGNSPYMCDILRVYVPADKVAYLTDPFDVNMIEIKNERDPLIYANSQVILEKGIEVITDIFAGLRSVSETSHLERLFIGSTDTWGITLVPAVSERLDAALSQVCDRRIRHASRMDVARVAARAWLALFFANYDTFCYAMIEALAGGCYVFCGEHLAYQQRPVTYCTDFVDAVKKIAAFVGGADRAEAHSAGREFVAQTYGLDVYRKQLMDILGRQLGV